MTWPKIKRVTNYTGPYKKLYLDSIPREIRLRIRIYFRIHSCLKTVFTQVEEDLLAEKMKIKKVSDEVNQTFDDMLSF